MLVQISLESKASKSRTWNCYVGMGLAPRGGISTSSLTNLVNSGVDEGDIEGEGEELVSSMGFDTVLTAGWASPPRRRTPIDYNPTIQPCDSLLELVNTGGVND